MRRTTCWSTSSTSSKATAPKTHRVGVICWEETAPEFVVDAELEVPTPKDRVEIERQRAEEDYRAHEENAARAREEEAARARAQQLAESLSSTGTHTPADSAVPAAKDKATRKRKAATLGTNSEAERLLPHQANPKPPSAEQRRRRRG